ncbi:MAG: aromatic-ring-hydroxylating dioxygenase subunit beta [Hyphomonadaceae bacterium]
MAKAPTRMQFEDFIYAEVALLDEWRLDDWLALFAEGATYHVPTAGAHDQDPKKVLFYIADDYARLKERVARLKKKEAHVEFPRSLLRHMISNVRVLKAEDGVAEVTCNFVTYRSKNKTVETYYGVSVYRIDYSKPDWKIIAKRSELDMDMLFPGKVSIII